MNSFDFLTNLPILIFTFIFFVIFIVFIRGGIILLGAKDEEREKKGNKVLLISLYSFLTILIVAFVFFLVTYFLQKGEVLRPSTHLGEFPYSPAVNFPHSPQLIGIDGYYFNGPWLLKENKSIKESAIYTILCKKNKEYDIIYIGETEREEQLLENEQYKCWLENCGQDFENLYLGVLWTPSGQYKPNEKKVIKENLIKQISPPCPPVQPDT